MKKIGLRLSRSLFIEEIQSDFTRIVIFMTAGLKLIKKRHFLRFFSQIIVIFPQFIFFFETGRLEEISNVELVNDTRQFLEAHNLVG